jgi:phage-related protein
MSVSLSSTINSVKDGSVFKDLSGSLNDITSVAATLPAALKAQFDTATAGVMTQMQAAQDNFALTCTVTSSAADLANKKSLEETGEPADPKESCGPLAIFEEGPALLKEKLDEILGGISEFASDFGAGVSEFADDALAAAKAVGEKISEYAAELQELISNVTNAVSEAAQELAQEALDAFNAANAAVSEAFDAVTSKINELVTDLTDSVNALVEKAQEAFDDAVAELKAFADSIQFSSLFNTECLAEVKDKVLDTEKLASTDTLEKAITLPALPAIPSLG